MKSLTGRNDKSDYLQRPYWGSGSATRLGARTTGWTVIHKGTDIGEITKRPNGTWMARPLCRNRIVVYGTEYRYRNDAERTVREHYRTYEQVPNAD